ncbi:protein of unassigned function [Methylobacterium oryzae CBMB20]|uniref:Protein of unassigned function n=1 Tax=Methylobacterium oryzae CBMB20 TaxID=693986 RepID=A0A089Q8B5_9HYPH|nr:protein of unassigned function [Methylobacterium oryzae CBMB20]
MGRNWLRNRRLVTDPVWPSSVNGRLREAVRAEAAGRVPQSGPRG